MTHSWALHPSCSKCTGCGYLCGLALSLLLMTPICHSRLSSGVSIFSALLPLILEPCASIPATSTVFRSCIPHLECREFISTLCCSSLSYQYSKVAFFKEEGFISPFCACGRTYLLVQADRRTFQPVYSVELAQVCPEILACGGLHN